MTRNPSKSAACVLGVLWGDEGKGKIIDVLAQDADVVARYGGGHNAGHTLVWRGERLVLHLKLNRVFEQLTARHEPPLYRAKRVKYFYATQVGGKPPSFVIFVNYPEGVHFSYLRYIENNLREAFGFHGSPIRIFAKRRREESGPGGDGRTRQRARKKPR